MRALVLVLAAAALPFAVGCGGDPPRGVQVTEATDDPAPPARPRQSLAFDTVYADTARFVDPRLDSLRRDPLRADSVLAATAGVPTPASEPANPMARFQTFWPRFKDAVRAGAEPTAALVRFSDDVRQDDFGATFESAFGAPFRDPMLALSPRDFRRAGTAREVTVTVGYDAQGGVVPEDEAETEESVTLRFDVVDGAYRLVSVALAD